MVESLKPIDHCFINADCIDGRGERSGGTELILPDRLKQCECATGAIKRVEAKSYHMTYGTPYHTGHLEDFENNIAKELGATIGSHEWYNINGVIIDMKHSISNTTVPHTRGTAMGREYLWNRIWAEHDEQPRAQVIIRSHVHWYFHVGNGFWLGVYTPALQGQGTKFGARQCSSHIDFGVFHIDIYNDRRIEWKPHLVTIEMQKVKPIVLS
jgi:hypothetical protein